MSIYGNPVMLGGSGGGGGGSTNILHGSDVPNESLGNNGSIYLQHVSKGAILPFDDSVTYDIIGNTWNAYGDPRISNEQSKFGGKSLYLNGSSYLTSAVSDNFDFGSKDFTISCWIYPTTTNRAAVFAMSQDCRIGTDIFFGQGSANLWLSSNGTSWNVLQSDNSGANTGQGTIPLSANTWTHLAFVRYGTSVRMYVNGQVARDATIAAGTSVYWSGTNGFSIGTWGNGMYRYVGYIDDFVVANGVALWQDTFTPPADPIVSVQGDFINYAYAKVSGAWQDLIGTDINDVDLGGGGSGQLLSGTSIPTSSIGNVGDTYIRYDSTSLAIAAVYFKGIDGWEIVWSREICVVQNYTGDANATFEYSAEDDLTVTFTASGGDRGIVFSTNGWNPEIITDKSTQMGRCQKTASLPTITNQGTGRDDFDIDSGGGTRTYVFAYDRNFFINISQLGSLATIRIHKSS